MADKQKELPEGEAPPKKSKFKTFIIIFLILLIFGTGGAGGAYWWFYMRTPADPSQETAQTKDGAENTAKTNNAEQGNNNADQSPRLVRQTDLPRSTGQVFPLPQFVVNLSDPTGKRYLKLGMEVEVNQDVSASIKGQSAKIRDAVIVLLAGKTFADISSAEGKVLLKAEVAARLNQILGGAYVVRVYFTEFVVE